MAEANAPVINEDADRVLGRIIIRSGLVTLLMLVIMTVVMTLVNVLIPGPLHRFLDTIGLLVVMLPFFIGTNKLFAARLLMGRELVGQKRWREAVAALDPFAGPTQRFLDKTGEAHYLLSLAYQETGDRVRAEAARAFVRHHRAGPWSERLSHTTIGRQEKRPPAPKSKPRRRY